MERNPFGPDSDAKADRQVRQARELESQFEQDIQSLDEAEIAEGDTTKNRVLDRMIPGHERRRFEQFAKQREALEEAYGMSSTELDYQEYGAHEPSNDEVVRAEEREESERNGLDFER